MSTTRLCILTSEYLPLRGGIGTYARQMALAAHELGAEVTMWAPAYGRAPDDPEIDPSIVVRRFSGGQHSARDVTRKLGAAWQATGERHDIVHAADWPFYLPLSFLPRGRAPQRLVTLHGTEANQMGRPLRHGVLKAVRWADRIDAFLCNSHFTRHLFLSHFPTAEPRTEVTLLGVSRFWCGQATSRTAARQALDLRPDDLVIVTVGRLTPRKGHLETLAGLAGLPPALRDRVVWLVVGPDIEADYVDRLKAGITATAVRTRLLGERSDTELRDIYAAADLFCLTGMPREDKVEGFGLVFLEAGGAGVPAVATRTGGVPDAVLNGTTGLLVNPGDTAALTAAIARVLGDDALRARLAIQARAYADKLSWRRCAAQSYGLTLPAAVRAAE